MLSNLTTELSEEKQSDIVDLHNSVSETSIPCVFELFQKSDPLKEFKLFFLTLGHEVDLFGHLSCKALIVCCLNFVREMPTV